MLLRIFKSSQPIVAIIIGIIAVLLRLMLFLTAKQTVELPVEAELSLAGYIYHFFDVFVWGSFIVTTVLVLGGGFYLNYLLHSAGLFDNFNYLTALFYILLFSATPDLILFGPAVFSSIFLLFAFQGIIAISVTNKRGPLIYNTAFFIGLASIVNPSAMAMYIPMVVSMLYFDAVKWRNWVFSVLGMLTPFFLTDALLYVFQDQFQSNTYLVLNTFINPNISILLHQPIGNWIIVILLIASLFVYFAQAQKSTARIRKLYGLFIWGTVVTILFTALSGNENSLISASTLFMAFIFTVFHLKVPKWYLSDLAIIAFLFGIALNHIQ